MNRQARRPQLLLALVAWLCQLWLPVLVHGAVAEPRSASPLPWCGGRPPSPAALPEPLVQTPPLAAEHRCATGCCVPAGSGAPSASAAAVVAARTTEPPPPLRPLPVAGRSAAQARVRGPPAPAVAVLPCIDSRGAVAAPSEQAMGCAGRGPGEVNVRFIEFA